MSTRGPRWLRLLRRAVMTTCVVSVIVVVLVFAAAAAYLGWARAHPVTIDTTAPGFTVSAGGVPTRVEHWPAGRPSALAPLVLVPGFAESTYVWSKVAPLLAADRDVYTYDVRGYGFSARVPPYTLEADTDQLAGLITALHLTRPVVVGHSLGVAIGLSLALRDPASVSGVVAANGDGTPYFGATRSTPSGWRRALLVDPIAPAVATAVMRHRSTIRDIVVARCGPACPIDDAAIDRWRAPFLSPGGIDALVSVLRAPLIGLTDQQETRITVPTAVLFSSADSTFDRAAAFATAARLRTHLVVELAGAQHLALLGEPDRFATALESELRSLVDR